MDPRKRNGDLLGPVPAHWAGVQAKTVAVTVSASGAAGHNAAPMASAAGVSNAETIGRVLYTNYVYYFQAAGFVLLVAMIGAIVLTLQHRPNVRRQVIADQVGRNRASGMRVVQIKSGEGIAP